MAISGAGNVAIYAAEKTLELGGTVITMSDSGGALLFEDGLSKEQLEEINDLKVVKKGKLSDYKGKGGELQILQKLILTCLASSPECEGSQISI